MSIHILVFPYPAQGHMLALLDLTHYLALQGFKITILVTPKNLNSLNTLLSTHPNSIQSLILPFPYHSKLPLGVEHVKDVGNSGNAPMIAALSKLEGDIIQWFASHDNPPRVIISDFFLGWTQNLAEKLNIQRIAFFSTSVILIFVLPHLFKNLDSVCNLEVVEFGELPKSPCFKREHLPSIFRKYIKGDPDWEIVKEGIFVNSKSWGFVINSFYDLEGEYLDHLKKKLGHNRVYGVGPLCLIGGLKDPNRPNLTPESKPKSDVISWLDKCPHGSVLYVCFGSQKPLLTAQIEALSLGLEKSMARFIWVVMPTVDDDRVLVGLENRVPDRGLVIRGYAPQVEILNHKGVGGFLSHCGLNSLLEGLVAGVLFLAWPMEADQFLNARLFVEDLGLGVRLAEGEDTVPDPNDLAETIHESMNGRLPQRDRVKLMKQKAFEALKDGGSSSRDLDELVKELSGLQMPKG